MTSSATWTSSAGVSFIQFWGANAASSQTGTVAALEFHSCTRSNWRCSASASAA